MTIARPGKIARCGAVWRYRTVSVSIVPHSGVDGSCGPRPRKPSPAASMIAVASASVACDDHRRDRVREDVRHEDRPPRHADRTGGEHEVVLLLSEHGTAQQPGEDRDVDDPDRDHDREEPGAEHRRDSDRHEQAGDGEHDVHQSHDHGVDRAARSSRRSRRGRFRRVRPTVTETTPMRSEYRAP